MADFNAVATQFVQFYYQQFDSDRNQLASLYRDHSMLTFESASVLGTKAIIEKLTSLPFQKVKHELSTLDAQPSPGNAGVLVLITGKLLVDDQEHGMNFTQTFQLIQEGGSYYVHNDLFKLVYG